MWDRFSKAFDKAVSYILVIATGAGLLIALLAVPADTIKTLGVWFRVVYFGGIALIVIGLIALLISPAVGAITRFRRPDLSITLVGEPNWINHGELALIVELCIRVTNNASRRKQLKGTGFQVTPHVNVYHRVDNDLEVRQYRDTLRQQHQMVVNLQWLEPGDHVSGWVIDIAGPPAAGPPTMKISVYDEFDQEYSKVIKGKPSQMAKRLHPTESWLKRAMKWVGQRMKPLTENIMHWWAETSQRIRQR